MRKQYIIDALYYGSNYMDQLFDDSFTRICSVYNINEEDVIILMNKSKEYDYVRYHNYWQIYDLRTEEFKKYSEQVIDFIEE